MAQPVLNVTELDFDQIKANLKSYFTRQNSPIKDWNFEGSGLNMLLDVLAYNTHYNAILAHLNLNESFIDTAQLRSSVISQAKLLGYVPTSIGAASVTITATFTSSGAPSTTATLVVPAGIKFTGTSPNGSYTFTTRNTYTPVVTSNSYYTIALPLIQGIYRSQTYQVDNTLANQRFTIEDTTADISTLEVYVFDNQAASSRTKFEPISTIAESNDIANVKGTSQIYYLTLNSNGKYEVTFGDGVLGQALNNLNIVQLTYISTQGPLANDISNFTYADSTLVDSDNLNITNVTVTASGYSTGGSDQESIDSIRINAPASLITQNRAVTANDYISILQRQNPEIVACNVWGGEDEVVYDPLNAARYAGKVFISYVSDTPLNSTNVIDALKPFKVMSVTPVYYAPDYINIVLGVNLKYNPNLTARGSNDLAASAKSVVEAYNTSALKRFTDVFRHSNLLRRIDTSDPAILNSDMQVSFYKDYVLNALTLSSDVITYGVQSLPNGMVSTFGNALNGTLSQTNSMVSSSGFALSSVLSPTQKAIQVFGSYSTSSPTIILSSSPGTSTLSSNNLTHPYLVVGSTVTSTAAGFAGVKISSINNTGSYSTITMESNSTGAAAAGTMLTIVPPGGTYYLKDGPDPASTSSRRLLMSTYSSATVANDPKYNSSGSDIHIGTVYPSTGKVELYTYFTGQATAQPVAGTSLNDTTSGGEFKDWYVNQFTSCSLYIIAGTGVGNSAVITTNSAETIYWTTPSITIDSTSRYVVIRSCINTTGATGNMKIYSRPASNDVAPSRHQLLSISNSVVTATADSFAQAGILGANSYTTFSRDPSA